METRIPTILLLLLVLSACHAPEMNTARSSSLAKTNVRDKSQIDSKLGETHSVGSLTVVSALFELNGEVGQDSIGFIADEDMVILIRVVGPSLVPFGRQAADHPKAVLNWSHQPMGQIRTWSEFPGSEREAIERIAQQLGAFPLLEASNDLVHLYRANQGAHSVRVSAPDDSGTVLVEIYKVPESFLSADTQPFIRETGNEALDL